MLQHLSRRQRAPPPFRASESCMTTIFATHFRPHHNLACRRPTRRNRVVKLSHIRRRQRTTKTPQSAPQGTVDQANVDRPGSTPKQATSQLSSLQAMGTGVVPDSPEVTADAIAGPRATALVDSIDADKHDNESSGQGGDKSNPNEGQGGKQRNSAKQRSQKSPGSGQSPGAGKGKDDDQSQSAPNQQGRLKGDEPSGRRDQGRHDHASPIY